MTEKDKLAKLYDFLKYDVEVSFLDGDVIDVATDVISKHIERIKNLEKLLSTHEPHGRNYTNGQYVKLRERVQELEKEIISTHESDFELVLQLQNENKRYHDFIKTVTETTLIAYEIQKDNPNIKFITPHHLFDWITSNASELIGSDSK